MWSDECPKIIFLTTLSYYWVYWLVLSLILYHTHLFYRLISMLMLFLHSPAGTVMLWKWELWRRLSPTLWQRHYPTLSRLQNHNIKHLVSRPFYYRQFWLFFSAIKTWELPKYFSVEHSFWQVRRTLVNWWLCLLCLLWTG